MHKKKKTSRSKKRKNRKASSRGSGTRLKYKVLGVEGQVVRGRTEIVKKAHNPKASTSNATKGHLNETSSLSHRGGVLFNRRAPHGGRKSSGTNGRRAWENERTPSRESRIGRYGNVPLAKREGTTKKKSSN